MAVPRVPAPSPQDPRGPPVAAAELCTASCAAPRWFAHQTPAPAALHFQVAGKRRCFLASSADTLRRTVSRWVTWGVTSRVAEASDPGNWGQSLAVTQAS